MELNEGIAKKNEIIGRFERKAGMFGVSHLNSHVDSLKQVQHKAQDENLNLKQIINKFSEMITKLKQELIFFNSELKKAMEAVGRKNETISRQKSLTELLQGKIGGTSTCPIDALKKTKQEFEGRFEKENEYFVGQGLKREKDDCAKRLSVFLYIQINKKV